jgi:hypothetical protein
VENEPTITPACFDRLLPEQYALRIVKHKNNAQNLQADSRASLPVTQETTDGEPLGASRVTLVGNVLPVPNPELAESASGTWSVTPTASTG